MVIRVRYLVIMVYLAFSVSACNDARLLYETIELGQTIDLASTYDTPQAVAGIPNLVCLGERTYGIRQDRPNGDAIGGFITDETGTVIAKLYAETARQRRLYVIRTEERLDESIVVDFILEETPTEEALRESWEGCIGRFALSDADAATLRYLRDTAFWHYMATDRQIVMESSSRHEQAEVSHQPLHSRSEYRVTGEALGLEPARCSVQTTLSAVWVHGNPSTMD